MAPLHDLLLRQCAPPTWTDETYTNKQYVRIALEKTSAEYHSIETEFRTSFTTTYEIISIERIQAPFLYCRFKLRQAHLAKDGRVVKEIRKYYQVREEYLDVVIQSNCDVRRHTYSTTYNYVIVGKHLLTGFDDKDSNRYPEYLIKVVEKRKDLSELLNGLRLF